MEQIHKSKITQEQRIVSLPNWFEECTDLFVQIIHKPAGIGFPDKYSPETRLNIITDIVRVSNLSRILLEHSQDNIWRSWQLFSDEQCSKTVSYVPLFLDIDNVDYDLESAYTLTRSCLGVFDKITQYNSSYRLRVVFSGMKGFHIEGRPSEPTNNRSFRKILFSGLEQLGIKSSTIPNCFPNGTIDPDHDFIRLTGSFNSWNKNNTLIKRKVIQLTLEDFRRSDIKNIIERSEAT